MIHQINFIYSCAKKDRYDRRLFFEIKEIIIFYVVVYDYPLK